MLISIIPSNAFATNTNKKVHMAGRPISTPANTIHNGKTAPTNAIGNDGDFYIDTLALDFYGPKLQGHWPAPVSLRGPAGSNGTDGKNGSNEKGTSQTGLTGPQGPAGPVGPIGKQGIPGAAGAQGPIGLTGPAGENGSVGLTGPAGQTGTPGATGPAGAAGSSGPQGSPGQQGPQGPPGNVGATGPQGATGSQGPQGSVGATGPSQIQIGLIQFPAIIRGNSGSSATSQSFGNFSANKQYLLRLSIYGVRSVSDFASLRIAVYSVGGTPVITSTYLISDGRSYRTALGESDTNLDVTVTLDGTLVTTPYAIGVTVSALEDTSTDSVTLAGSYVSQLVGALN